MSSISWLDASTEEQRRMREVLGLFTERDTREELGLGQIRDAVADGLFPGTSTLHSRARYFLFIPWVYRLVSQGRDPSATRARNQELALIPALKSSGGDVRGLIGAEAGSTLKTVPSSVYWSALGSYGILNDPGLSRGQALEIEGAEAPIEQQISESGDRGKRRLRAWRSSLPEPPAGFPGVVFGGMSLTADEASWLQERILDSTAGTLLAHLAVNEPDGTSGVPWEDLSALSVTGIPRHLLEHARRFSDTIQGAQLLYNLLIAESYEEAGFTRQVGRRDEFLRRFSGWSGWFESHDPDEPWDLDDFFAIVTSVRRKPVAAGSEKFVREWVDLLREHGSCGLEENEKARKLVQDRERRNKGAMARIGNPKRLESWGGSSGAGRFVYRWGYVQTILHDIHRGLASPIDAVSPAEFEVARA